LSFDYALHTTNNIGWVANNLELDQVKLAMGDDQFSQVFGGQQDVPSILDRLTTPALNPNWDTVVHGLLTNPDGSLSAIVNNLPVVVKDIELPMVLALLRPEVIFAQTAENVQNAISSDQWSAVLPALSQGIQGLGSVFSDTWTDPATSITAGILNAYNDLAVSIMNADTYAPLSLSDFTSVWDQLSEFDQSVSQMLSAGLSALLDTAGL
jgi:hypothetical protein